MLELVRTRNPPENLHSFIISCIAVTWIVALYRRWVQLQCTSDRDRRACTCEPTQLVRNLSLHPLISFSRLFFISLPSTSASHRGDVHLVEYVTCIRGVANDDCLRAKSLGLSAFSNPHVAKRRIFINLSGPEDRTNTTHLDTNAKSNFERTGRLLLTPFPFPPLSTPTAN